MPLTMGDTKSDDYFIAASDDLGLKGSSLGPGQTVSVESADPSTVVVTPDATVRNAPDGTVCVASGKVSSAKPPAKPNSPINLTAHVSNSDGTPGTDDTGAVIADAVDTVQIQPGLGRSIGILFGVPA